MQYSFLDKKLHAFKLIAQEKLQAIIYSIPGKKELIIESNIIKPLEHICSASWLKLKGIQRIFKLDNNNPVPRTSIDQVFIFLIQSNLDVYQRVLLNIQLQCRQFPNACDNAIKHFHIVCVPNCFIYFKKLLEKEGLYGLVQLHRFNWDFILLDKAVLSMEIANVFPRVYLHADTSILPSIAQSLRVLQMMSGRPELIVTFGEHSSNVIKMLKTLEISNKANKGPNVDNKQSDFSTFLIIDRSQDFTSCLLTPTIYAGLLLEVFYNAAGEIDVASKDNKIAKQKLQLFSIQNRKIDNYTSTKKSEAEKNVIEKTLVMRFNSRADEIYAENCYKHFTEASNVIRTQSKAIGVEINKLSNMKLDEMQDYVTRTLPKITKIKSKLMRHLKASEQIIKMLASSFRKVQSLEEDILNNVSRKRIMAEIDELLVTDGQQYNSLRLMCLFHMCAGVQTSELTIYARNYCNYYGIHNIQVFNRLAMSGLLPVLTEEAKPNKSMKLLSNLPILNFQQTEFQANANRLKLLVSTADTTNPSVSDNSNRISMNESCPSFVFGGRYIPFLAQLCSFLIKSQSVDDLASKIGFVEKIQIHMPKTQLNTPQNVESFSNNIKLTDTKDPLPLKKRNLFVFIVGGVTYAEIASCNMVARTTDSEIVVASDRIISGADLIASTLN